MGIILSVRAICFIHFS